MAVTPWSIKIGWEYNNWLTHEYAYEYESDNDSTFITDNIFSAVLYTLNEWNVFSNNTTHIAPRDWYELVWFVLNWEYNDYDSSDNLQWTKSFTDLKVQKWDSQTFWSLVTDNPYRSTDTDYLETKCGFILHVTDVIRKDNQNNTITTSFKDNVEYKLWGGGGGEWGLVRADNSPDKPKYWRVGSEEDYQALENKYTEQENDTMFFTY